MATILPESENLPDQCLMITLRLFNITKLRTKNRMQPDVAEPVSANIGVKRNYVGLVSRETEGTVPMVAVVFDV